MSQEEDLISLCRRLIRTTYKYQVINVAFSGWRDAPVSHLQINLMQNYLKQVVAEQRGQIFFMHDGDAVIILRRDLAASIEKVLDSIRRAAMADEVATGQKAPATGPEIRLFDIPEQYEDFRELTNTWLDGARHRTDPEKARDTYLAMVPLEGNLSAPVISRIEAELEDLDIRPFLRRQNVYSHHGQNDWQPVFEEVFTSVHDLKDKVFPNVTFGQSDVEFAQLARLLDAKLMTQLMQDARGPEQPRSINVTLSSLQDPVFRLFSRNLPIEQRGKYILEISHRDILRDLGTAMQALRYVRDLGFQSAIDGITMDFLAYVRVGKLPVDWYKLTVDKAHLAYLKDRDVIAAIKSISPDRIIVCRCDSEEALNIGQAFGLSKYQGWMVDELAAPRQRRLG